MRFLLAFLMTLGCTQSPAFAETILVGDALQLNPYYSSVPANCTVGDAIAVSGALQFCGSPNTWTALGAGGGSGTGTVTSVSVATANGLSGTVANPTTTPVITLGTPVSGILYGNNGGIFAAIASNFPTLNQNTTGNAASATNISGGAAGNVVYQSAPGVTAFLANGTTGTVLQSNGVGLAPSWSSSASGSVTSVGVVDASTAPIYASSGSPVTSSGTIDLTLNTEPPNTVFSGDPSGLTAQPTFRHLVAADLPSGTGSVTSVDVQDTSGTPLFVSSGGPITSSGIIDLTLASGAGNLVLATPSGVTGQPVLRTLVPQDIPGGTGIPNTFAAYDPSGNLNSAPGWAIDSMGQAGVGFTSVGATNMTSLQFFPGISTPLSGGYEGIIVSPQLSSSMAFSSMFNAETDFQSGYNNSGGTGIFQDQSTFDAGASTANYDSYGAFTQITGTVGNLTPFTEGMTVNPGSSVSQFTGFNTHTNFNEVVSGNINGFTASQGLNQNVGGGVQVFGDFNGIAAGVTIPDYESISMGPNFAAGSSIATLVSAHLSPTINGNITGQYDGIMIAPTGSGTIAQANAITVDLHNILTGSVQKTGLNVNDGSLSVTSNYDTSILSPTPGEFGNNQLGGTFHIASGFPMSGSFGFGNNLGIEIFAEDNMAPDLFLGTSSLGYSITGFANQTAVVAGKTVDTLNYMFAGGEAPPMSTGGTVTNLSMFRAVGLIPAGGTLNVGNLWGYKADPGLCAISPTNCWSFYSADPAADNWFKKDVVIGGTTGLSAGAYQLDVTGNSYFNGYFDQNGIAPPAVSNANQGRIYYDLGTNTFMASENGGAYVPLIGGGGGGSGTVSIVSVVTANGFSGTVANATTTPAITLTGTLTGDVTGTINANALTATSNSTLTSLPNLVVNGSQVSGAVASATLAASATNLSAGLTGNVVYQSAPGVTGYLANGASGTVLQSNGVGVAPSWVTSGSGGSGTVTSVALADGSTSPIFSISGSPVTSSGTLTETLISQAANLFLASPNGAPGQPTFRSIVAADVPTLNQNTTGNASTATTATNLASGVIGDIPYQTAANTTAFIAPGTSGFVLTSNGPGSAPTYQAAGGASYTFSDSLVNTAGNVTLVNDNPAPGNSMYYGTNGTGTLGYYTLGSALNNWSTNGSDIYNNNTGNVGFYTSYVGPMTTPWAPVSVGARHSAAFTEPQVSMGQPTQLRLDVGFSNDDSVGYLQSWNVVSTPSYEPLELQPLGGGVGVGLGATVPAALLEVNGTSQFDGQLTMSSTNQIVGQFTLMNSSYNTQTTAWAPYSAAARLSASYTEPQISVGQPTQLHLDVGFSNQNSTGYIQSWNVVATPSYSPLLLQPLGGNTAVGGTNASPDQTLTVYGHIGLEGSSPTISSCGVGSSIDAGSSDHRGHITVVGAATACTITFASAMSTGNSCSFTTNVAGNIPTITSLSTSAVTVGMLGLNGVLYWVCL